jgi:hypothetical protein
MVASSDEHFREMVRDNLLNIPEAKIVAEYQEVAANLYIRVLQDLERHPHAGLIVDLSGDPEGAIKAIEKVKQAAPYLFVAASNYHADAETAIACMRAGANEFLLQPIKRTEFREAMGRLDRAPRLAGAGESKLGKVYTFLGTRGGVGTTTLAVNFVSVLAQRKLSSVILDLDWIGNDVAMQLGASPQYTLTEVAENLERMDQALFEGFVTRDPLGFFMVGPPDALEPVSRVRRLPGGEVRRDRGRWRPRHFRRSGDGRRPDFRRHLPGDRSGVSLHPERPALHFLSDAHGPQPGPDPPGGEPLYQEAGPQYRDARTDSADPEPAGILRHSAIAGGDRRHQQGSALRGQPRGGRGTGPHLQGVCG